MSVRFLAQPVQYVRSTLVRMAADVALCNVALHYAAATGWAKKSKPT